MAELHKVPRWRGWGGAGDGGGGCDETNSRESIAGYNPAEIQIGQWEIMAIDGYRTIMSSLQLGVEEPSMTPAKSGQATKTSHINLLLLHPTQRKVHKI